MLVAIIPIDCVNVYVYCANASLPKKEKPASVIFVQFLGLPSSGFQKLEEVDDLTERVTRMKRKRG